MFNALRHKNRNSIKLKNHVTIRDTEYQCVKSSFRLNNSAFTFLIHFLFSVRFSYISSFLYVSLPIILFLTSCVPEQQFKYLGKIFFKGLLTEIFTDYVHLIPCIHNCSSYQLSAPFTFSQVLEFVNYLGIFVTAVKNYSTQKKTPPTVMSITAVYVLDVCSCISYICIASCVLCSYRLFVSGGLGDTCIVCRTWQPCPLYRAYTKEQCGFNSVHY